jgi:hypothetical protein
LDEKNLWVWRRIYFVDSTLKGGLPNSLKSALKDTLKEDNGDTHKLVTQTYKIMIIPNEGLGTGMGLKHIRTLLTEKDGKSFLETIVEQAACKGVNLVFINSFNTHKDTMTRLRS